MVKPIQEIASITGTFRANLIAWFANAANGITDFFAKAGHFDEVCAKNSDGTEACVDGDQLKSLLNGGAAAAGAPMLRDTVEAPATSPSSEENDSGDEANATSTELRSEDAIPWHNEKAVENSPTEEENRFRIDCQPRVGKQPTTTRPPNLPQAPNNRLN
jgi:hypothetical protein